MAEFCGLIDGGVVLSSRVYTTVDGLPDTAYPDILTDITVGGVVFGNLEVCEKGVRFGSAVTTIIVPFPPPPPPQPPPVFTDADVMIGGVGFRNYYVAQGVTFRSAVTEGILELMAGGVIVGGSFGSDLGLFGQMLGGVLFGGWNPALGLQAEMIGGVIVGGTWPAGPGPAIIMGESITGGVLFGSSVVQIIGGSMSGGVVVGGSWSEAVAGPMVGGVIVGGSFPEIVGALWLGGVEFGSAVITTTFTPPPPPPPVIIYTMDGGVLFGGVYPGRTPIVDPATGITYYTGSAGGDRGFTDQREILLALEAQILAMGLFTDPSYVNIGRRDPRVYQELPVDTYGCDIYIGRKVIDQSAFAGSGTFVDIRTEVVFLRVYTQNQTDFSDYLAEWATTAYGSGNAYSQARRVSDGVHGRDIVDWQGSGAILTIQPCRVLSIGEPEQGPQGWSAVTIELEVMYRERPPEIQ